MAAESGLEARKKAGPGNRNLPFLNCVGCLSTQMITEALRQHGHLSGSGGRD